MASKWFALDPISNTRPEVLFPERMPSLNHIAFGQHSVVSFGRIRPFGRDIHFHELARAC
jgi:hypothetical protein